jgi:hypothetical protein
MKFDINKRIFFTLACSLIISCSADDFCEEPIESTAFLSFYTHVGGILNDTSVTGFSVTGLIDYDSLLYDSVSTSSFELPFSASSNSSSFILSFSIPDTLFLTDTTDTILWHSEFDTISFSYSPELYFISQPCGFTYHYMVDCVRYSKNIIDTITISSGLVTTKENENCKVLL